jgi:hypothetical protein
MFGQDDTQSTNQSPTSGSLNDAAMGGPSATPFVAPPNDTPTNDMASFPAPSINAPSAAPGVVTPSSAISDDLLTMKQEALQQLSPLVDQLDQTPEEKFRTTMMMIQASDDQTLLKSAYDTAKQITDEKVRAQALLDVINEINYFTQQHHTN